MPSRTERRRRALRWDRYARRYWRSQMWGFGPGWGDPAFTEIPGHMRAYAALATPPEATR